MSLINVTLQIQQRLILSIGLISLYKALLITIISLLTTSCWEKNYDYEYDTYISNETSDTLTLIVGLAHINNPQEYYRKISILPKDTLGIDESGLGGTSVNEREDPVRNIFEKEFRYFDTVLVYHKDTLKCIWTAPASSKPESEHDFFNFNSWETGTIKDLYPYRGFMVFSLFPEDLIVNIN